MALSISDIAKLRRIITLAENLVAKESTRSSNGAGRKRKGKRVRRSGAELVRFRKMLKAQRRKGVPVAELARKYSVSGAYIYTLP